MYIRLTWYMICRAHVMVDFLECILSEGGEGCWMSAAQSDGVMDALQHPQLPQVNLRRLRLQGEGG